MAENEWDQLKLGKSEAFHCYFCQFSVWQVPERMHECMQQFSVLHFRLEMVGNCTAVAILPLWHFPNANKTQLSFP